MDETWRRTRTFSHDRVEHEGIFEDVLAKVAIKLDSWKIERANITQHTPLLHSVINILRRRREKEEE